MIASSTRLYFSLDRLKVVTLPTTALKTDIATATTPLLCTIYTWIIIRELHPTEKKFEQTQWYNNKLRRKQALRFAKLP